MSWLIIKQESQRYREVFERRVGILLKGKKAILATRIQVQKRLILTGEDSRTWFCGL